MWGTSVRVHVSGPAGDAGGRHLQEGHGSDKRGDRGGGDESAGEPGGDAGRTGESAGGGGDADRTATQRAAPTSWPLIRNPEAMPACCEGIPGNAVTECVPFMFL